MMMSASCSPESFVMPLAINTAIHTAHATINALVPISFREYHNGLLDIPTEPSRKEAIQTATVDPERPVGTPPPEPGSTSPGSPGGGPIPQPAPGSMAQQDRTASETPGMPDGVSVDAKRMSFHPEHERSPYGK